MKACVGMETQLHASFTSTLYAGDWSASGPDRLTKKKSPGNHWVDLKVGFDVCKLRKSLGSAANLTRFFCGRVRSLVTV